MTRRVDTTIEWTRVPQEVRERQEAEPQISVQPERRGLSRRMRLARTGAILFLTALTARGAVAVAQDINEFATDHFGTEYGQGELAHKRQITVPLQQGEGFAQGEGLTAAIESVDPKLAGDGQGLADVTKYVTDKLAAEGKTPLTATSITVPFLADQQPPQPQRPQYQ